MKFFIDGALLIAASDAKDLSPGTVGIFTSQEYMGKQLYGVSMIATDGGGSCGNGD